MQQNLATDFQAALEKALREMPPRLIVVEKGTSKEEEERLAQEAWTAGEKPILLVCRWDDDKPAAETAPEPMAEPVEVEVIAPAPAPAPGPIPRAAPATPTPEPEPEPEPEPAAPAPEAAPAPRTFEELRSRHTNSPTHRRWAKRHGCEQCAEEARQQGLIGNILPGQLLG